MSSFTNDDYRLRSKRPAISTQDLRYDTGESNFREMTSKRRFWCAILAGRLGQSDRRFPLECIDVTGSGRLLPADILLASQVVDFLWLPLLSRVNHGVTEASGVGVFGGRTWHNGKRRNFTTQEKK